MKKSLKKIYWGVFLFSFFIISCGEQDLVYEGNQELKNAKWFWQDTLTYSFEIQDTTKSYDIYYQIENGIDYPFQNLYITYYLENEKGEVVNKLLQNITLMDTKTGEPFGESNWEGNFENQPLALEKIKFAKAGKYTFKVQQYMRVDSLPEIQKFGIKIIESPKTAP